MAVGIKSYLNTAMAYNNRGNTYIEQGKKAEAKVNFERFITIADNPVLIEMARQQTHNSR